MRTRSLLCGCIILLVIVVARVSPCFAENLIYGCVKNSGDLVIVSGPGQCKANQTPISWNQAGPAGVANGITTAVHGVVRYDGEIEDGVGFTVGAPTGPGMPHDTGLYRVIFDTAFSNLAHCVVTPFQSPATVICGVSGFGEWGFDVDCYAPTTEVGVGGVILFTNLATDVSFSFICVE
jgi:hypothetical protein